MLDTPSEARRPRAWLAAVLSVLWAGAGHLYAGERRRAGLLGVLHLLIVPLLAWFMVYVATNAWSMALPLLLATGAWVWVVLDASHATRRQPAMPWTRLRLCLVLAAATTGVWLALGIIEDVVRHRIARAVRVPTVAMAPTLLAGDYVFLTPVTSSRLARGDLVVWQSDDGREFIHRVAGLPADTLAMRESVFYRNGQAVVEPYARYEIADSAGRGAGPSELRQWCPLVVPADSVFVLGDNRDSSADSRVRGFVPIDGVISRPRRIYFSREPETGTIRWHRIGARPDQLAAQPATPPRTFEYTRP